MTDLTEERVLELIAENQGDINASIGSLVSTVDAFEALLIEFQSTILPGIQSEVANSSISIDDISDNQLPTLSDTMVSNLATLAEFNDVWLPSLQETDESLDDRIEIVEQAVGVSAFTPEEIVVSDESSTLASPTLLPGLTFTVDCPGPEASYLVVTTFDIKNVDAIVGDCVGNLVIDAVLSGTPLVVNVPQDVRVTATKAWIVTDQVEGDHVIEIHASSNDGADYLIGLYTSMIVARLK